MCILLYGLMHCLQNITDLLVVLLECFLIEQSASMSTNDNGCSSSLTVITGAVDDPRVTEKTSHAASLAAEYEPGRAKAFAAWCRIFSAQRCANPFLPICLARVCHAVTTGLKI